MIMQLHFRVFRWEEGKGEELDAERMKTKVILSSQGGGIPLNYIIPKYIQVV